MPLQAKRQRNKRLVSACLARYANDLNGLIRTACEVKIATESTAEPFWNSLSLRASQSGIDALRDSAISTAALDEGS